MAVEINGTKTSEPPGAFHFLYVIDKSAGGDDDDVEARLLAAFTRASLCPQPTHRFLSRSLNHCLGNLLVVSRLCMLNCIRGDSSTRAELLRWRVVRG